MAITDIQISEELETNAPSIKYRGNEGPKSPEEEMQMADAMLKEEYEKYVYDLLEIRPEATPMSFEEFKQMVIAEGQMSGGQPLPQDPTKPVNPFAPKPTGPTLPNRQMAAFGGIMDRHGRRRYGLGSKLKRAVRKIIPNEVADVAVKAAPFVAPFNPLAAGLMSGIGGFDQHGSLSKGLKSGLMNYGMGQVARVAGGAGPQWGLTNPSAGANASFMNKYLSSPYVAGEDIFSKTKQKYFPGKGESIDATEILGERMGDNSKRELGSVAGRIAETKKAAQGGTSGIMDFINKNSTAILLGSMGLAAATASQEDVQDAVRVSRGTGLDIDKIRAEVQEAFEGGEEAWNELKRTKYPYMGEFATKKAYGGRIGKAEGGIMDLGGMEKDYRNTGGFVDLGAKEKADDVPARLSVNEFVMTADAVRGAGGGDIDKGAEIMENVMKNLEEGGRISEESQGLTNRRQGASDMFEVSERLSAVI